MEKEINEVKITYLAETGTGLVHLLMNNYDDNGRSVFDIELSASNDLSDRYCSAYPKLKAILELFSNIISKYKS